MPAGEVDLAATVNGGRAVAWNDAHYGSPSNLLAPGEPVNMGDGWETARRRVPGNDWAIVRLGHAGILESATNRHEAFQGKLSRPLFAARRLAGRRGRSLFRRGPGAVERTPPRNPAPPGLAARSASRPDRTGGPCASGHLSRRGNQPLAIARTDRSLSRPPQKYGLARARPAVSVRRP